MRNITVISTIHKEIGNCNPIELCKIIESIKPEIIFEELSINAFKRCYNLQNLTTLESDAIKLYMLHYEIQHIPVVGTELEIDSKINLMIKYGAYREQIDQLSNFEGQFGFQFLNSISCVKMFDKIKEVEQSILKEKNDEILYQINNNSEKEIDRYENEIIENIYDCSKFYSYDNAILLFGAAHRKSIIEKINYLNAREEASIKWTIYTPSNP